MPNTRPVKATRCSDGGTAPQAGTERPSSFAFHISLTVMRAIFEVWSRPEAERDTGHKGNRRKENPESIFIRVGHLARFGSGKPGPRNPWKSGSWWSPPTSGRLLRLGCRRPRWRPDRGQRPRLPVCCCLKTAGTCAGSYLLRSPWISAHRREARSRLPEELEARHCTEYEGEIFEQALVHLNENLPSDPRSHEDRRGEVEVQPHALPVD